MSSRRTLFFAGLLVTVASVALAARLSPWDSVFTQSGIRLLHDTDPHYHLLRAERMATTQEASWFDPWLDFPRGARTPWPPGFDAFLLQVTRLFEGPQPSLAEIEAVAVFIPVFLGMLVVLCVGLIWFRVGGAAAGLFSAGGAAVLPMLVEYSTLGGVDQHVAEQLLLCLAVLMLERTWRGRPGGVPGLAVVLALAPWLWHGSTVLFGFCGLAAAALVLVARRSGDEDRRLLARLCGSFVLAALLLAVSFVFWGPPPQFRAEDLNGFSLLHPATSLAAGAVFAAGWWSLRHANRGPVFTAIVLTAAAVGTGVVLVASFPSAVSHGLRSLASADPWRATISEYQPLFLGGTSALRTDVLWWFWGTGPVLFAPLWAFRALPSRLRSAPATAGAFILVVVASVSFGVLALVMSRFRLYAGPFLVICAGLIAADLLRSRRFLGTIAVLAVSSLPAITLLRGPFQAVPREDVIELLRFAGGPERAAGAVLAPWTYGHAIAYYARRPPIVTPFGIDVGRRGMETAAAFYFAPSPQDAERILRVNGIGMVIIDDSLRLLGDIRAFAPPGAPEFVASDRDYWGEGTTWSTTPAYDVSMPGWLYAYDGVQLATVRTEANDWLRLIDETPGQSAKLFERVEGARVRIRCGRAGVEAAVHLDVVTPRFRSLRWWARAETGGNGDALVRVPYATGSNGRSRASTALGRCGGETFHFDIPEDAVVGGREVVVAASSAAAAIPKP